MTTTRRWVAGAVVAALVLALASWFLLISPQRSQAAELRDQAVEQQRTNESIRLQTQQLKAQFASLPQRQAELAEIRRQMPGTPDLASLVRQLSAAAAEAGVSLTSVSPGQPQPFDAAAAAAGAGTGAAAARTGTGAAAAGTGAAAARTGTGAAAAGTGAPASGTSGVQAIGLTTVLDGSYADLTLFVQNLQGSMPRAYLVESLTLAPADGADAAASGSDLTMTLAGKVFVLASTTGTGTTSSATPTTAN